MPKGHYKIFYTSDLSGKEAYVLVDLIEDSSLYPIIIDTEIRLIYFQAETPYAKVKTPNINGILGDKMTAFAPRTTGIKLGTNKEMEIAKQLFDVASLFDHADNFTEVKKSFVAVAEKEIKYRDLKIGHEEVLIDSFNAAMIIAFQGSMEKEIYNELQEGTKKLKGYIFNNFGHSEVHICAAKIAYLSQAIQKGVDKTVVSFNNEDLSKAEIKNKEFSRLNKIKKISPAAFYYWKAAIDLLTE
ncbi:MAG: nucleotidyl transferase AbiEii/AbiGii toxin family protein [Oligoflexia bacterium]|nr:nucleotidyl transferase AbiEii/AbiGii toxin family protein [Oligoflexia bacterium]